MRLKVEGGEEREEGERERERESKKEREMEGEGERESEGERERKGREKGREEGGEGEKDGGNALEIRASMKYGGDSLTNKNTNRNSCPMRPNRQMVR